MTSNETMVPTVSGGIQMLDPTRDVVLVTGASGFIGGHLVHELLARGYETHGLDRREPTSSLGACKFVQVDLRDTDAVANVMRTIRPTVVFHLAAESSVVVAQAHPEPSTATNVRASATLAELAVEVGTRRFVFFSTGGAMYGDATTTIVDETERPSPLSVYGVSKWAAECLLRGIAKRSQLELSILRPGNVYGPGQDPAGESGVIAIFTERMLRDEPITLYGEGKHVRDYVHVSDVVEAALCAASGTPALCHVSSGTAQTTRDVFNALARACGYNGVPRLKPAREGEINGVVLSPTRAHEAWGWRPTVSFEAGIASTVAWYRETQQQPTSASVLA